MCLFVCRSLSQPTTGLDAAGAYSVCHAIRNLANHIAVIATIHQPSSEIIRFFDGLILMQPGGQIAYCGAVETLPEYFAEHHLGQYDPNANVADFALESVRYVNSANAQHQKNGTGQAPPAPAAGSADVAGGANIAVAKDASSENKNLLSVPVAGGAGSSASNESPSRSASPGSSDPSKPDITYVRDLAKEFKESNEGQQLLELLRSGGLHHSKEEVQQGTVSVRAGDAGEGGFVVPPPPMPLRSFWTQLCCLMSRDLDAVMRNHEELFVRYFLTVVMGFVVGTVFFRLSYTQIAADERVSALFVTLLFIMFTANAFLPQMFFSRPMYFRETTAGAYSCLPSYLSRLIVQLPFVLTEQLILAIMLFYIANLNDERHDTPLAWMYFCFVITRYASITATIFIGALFAEPNNANTLHATYFNLLFVFTGFLVRGPRIPIGWVWFYDINYLRWALEFLVANEVRNSDFTCSRERGDWVLAPATYDTCQDPQSVTTISAAPNLIPFNAAPSSLVDPNTILKCPFACGRDLMESYGVDYSDADMARSLGLVAVFACAFGIAGFITLKYVNHIRR